MWLYSAILTIHVEEFGSVKNLKKAMEVYKNNNCVVISDEIWSDIILDDNHHTPLSSISEDARTAPFLCMHQVRHSALQD